MLLCCLPALLAFDAVEILAPRFGQTIRGQISGVLPAAECVVGATVVEGVDDAVYLDGVDSQSFR